MDTPKYKRVLLKLSGEALADKSGKDILDHAKLDEVAKVIKKALDMKVQVAIIVGAGNIWRGRQASELDRVRADHMGMLATMINCIALEDAIKRAGAVCHVMSAVTVESFAERFDRKLAVEALERGEAVIFGAGLGIPFVSTDTAAAVRAAEIGADMILFAKNIDGIYSADPKLDPNAVHYDSVTYDFILENNLKVMDQTAASFCRENKLNMLVFALDNPESILDALSGNISGTVVTVIGAEFETKMKKSIAAYEEELDGIRAGRANPAVLNKVTVDYYGAQTPISQVADVKATDARTLVITPWDMSVLKGIEKAILASDIGITPMNDGKVLRLTFPQLTEERRRELTKQVSKSSEDAKVAIRNIRRDANDKIKAMKKNSEMTEDEAKESEKSVQDLTDKYIKNIDEISAAKEKELLSI